MEVETIEQRTAKYLRALVRLRPLGFIPLGNFRFAKNGLIYDLSAADLGQIERIEREGLFVEVS